MTVSQIIRRRVVDLRQNSGLSQDELAARLRGLGFTRWTRSAVAALESDRRQVSLSDLVGLAAVFECRLEDLVILPGAATVELDDGPRLATSDLRAALGGGVPRLGPAAAGTGDLERSLAERLDKRLSLDNRVSIVLATSAEMYGRTPTEERNERARQGRAKQWASRDIAKEMADKLTRRTVAGQIVDALLIELDKGDGYASRVVEELDAVTESKETAR